MSALTRTHIAGVSGAPLCGAAPTERDISLRNFRCLGARAVKAWGLCGACVEKVPADCFPAGLFWSERGAVACAAHAPYRGSDTWRWERWRRITPKVLAEIVRQGGIAGRSPRCEVCGKEAA
jgi:hypothetical protein